MIEKFEVKKHRFYPNISAFLNTGAFPISRFQSFFLCQTLEGRLSPPTHPPTPWQRLPALVIFTPLYTACKIHTCAVLHKSRYVFQFLTTKLTHTLHCDVARALMISIIGAFRFHTHSSCENRRMHTLTRRG